MNQDQKEYLEIVNHSGKSLLLLIEDILDFSKMDAGKMKFEFSEFSYDHVLKEVLLLLKPKAVEKEIEIIVKTEPAARLNIYADPQRFRQIVMNLLGNAIKFTEKGTIQILIQPERTPAEGVEHVRISVIDSGVGVPEDKSHLLFGLFSQIDSSHIRKYGGTGLGLAISKRLVELMKGNIGYERRAEGGSIFWFSLPSWKN